MLLTFAALREAISGAQKKKDWERIQELANNAICLKKMLQRYKEFWDHSSEAFLLMKSDKGDPSDAYIIDANPAACSLYGYTHEAITKLTILDLSAEPEGTRETWDSRNTFVPFRYHKNSSGTRILINGSLTYFKDNSGAQVAALIARPITVRRRSDVTSHEQERISMPDGQRLPHARRKTDNGT